MKMISLTCPQCEAPIDVAEGRQVYYCPYCGNKILIDDNSIRIDINYRKKTEHIDRKIDEAEIAKMEVLKAYNNSHSWIETVVVFGVLGICLIVTLVVLCISEMQKYKPVKVANKQGVEEVVKPSRVKLKYEERELIGEQVEDVKKYFESEGFLFITTVPHKKGLFSEEGAVSNVEIDGYKIRKSMEYSTSEEVVISYYSETVF